MIRSVQYFKNKFVVGYKITQEDYADWLDSFLHATAGISVSNISDLSTTLNNYRLKNVNIPAGEITGLAAAIAAQTTNFLTTSSTINQSQITGLVTALSNCTSVTEVQEMIDTALADFNANNTPHIEAGVWWIGDVNTGVQAEGQDGATPTITIGGNGNWYINGVDTTHSASGGASGFVLAAEHQTADDFTLRLSYNDANGDPQSTSWNIGGLLDLYTSGYIQTDNGGMITGAIDGVNRNFYTSQPFRVTTLRVYRGGRKMRQGNDKDYVIAVDGSSVPYVKFNYNVPVDDTLEFEYMTPFT